MKSPVKRSMLRFTAWTRARVSTWYKLAPAIPHTQAPQVLADGLLELCALLERLVELGDQARAKVSEGVLTIQIPKRDTPAPVGIPVTAT